MIHGAPYLEYRVTWRAGAPRPGRHASRQAGRDGDFRGYRPFWQLPDAQRIDLRRSMMDPFGGVLVRQMEQRSAVTLVLAVDVSRSMAPAQARTHIGAIVDLLGAASRSALRAGDAIGVLAFDEAVRHDLSAAPSRQPLLWRDAAGALLRFSPAGRNAAGIADLANHLPRARCLVLLVSDFLMPDSLLAAALGQLSRHDVAPVVMGDAAAPAMSRNGLLRVRDAETGMRRLVFMRPGLRRRAQAAAAARRDTLDRLFAVHGRAAFHAGHGIDVAALSQHLTAP
jgi:uncharacterized protein (DUF58 family)